ncbi:MAG: type II toxin-antitoxin system RelE/ParE family toxin [Cytophagaceae bacterium]|nr:type II toxin-antitoxin system RelE/ParE family toxin [Cytophagaceae bacterium]
MVRIEWTPLAYEDLESIYKYISKDSIFYASRQIDTLISRVDILEEYPLAGKIVPEFNNEFIRELIEGSYRIIYKIGKDTIFIIRIHHSARNLKEV